MSAPDPRSGVTPWWCPGCGEKLDRASGVGHQARPGEGDVTLCFYCGEILVFDAHGIPERPEDLEAFLASLPAATRRRVLDTQATLRTVAGMLAGRG